MKSTIFTAVTVLAFAVFAVANPVPAPVPEAYNEAEVIKTLKERNPSCVPFCLYPGDTCCSCCH